MFGFIRPVREELRVRELERFKSVYCGLCHAIGARYGRFHTFFLSYDMTFCALVLGCTQENANTVCLRCDASPLKKKCVAQADEAINRAADFGVLLNYHKLRDNCADEKGAKRLAARLLLRFAAPGYRKARERLPDEDAILSACVDELAVLEREKCSSIDRAADPTARLLQEAAPKTGDAQERILRQLFYHTGRWVYLIDACYDLERDFKEGAYNPVALRFGLTKPSLASVREAIELTLERSLIDIHTAYQLLDVKKDAGILQNIIELGMPIVTGQVLDGVYHTNGGQGHHGSI